MRLIELLVNKAYHEACDPQCKINSGTSNCTFSSVTTEQLGSMFLKDKECWAGGLCSYALPHEQGAFSQITAALVVNSA
jgi:hypothetical protein